jgi:polysaccharide export outer membrane protein
MSEGGSSPYGSVLVTGCVGREGVVDIPQTCDLTVMQALQLAGGMGQWANINGVRLTRNLADGTRQQVTIDTEHIGRRGATDQNIVLMPGDVLYVPESNW